jgi:hypothetical protein
MIPGRSLQTLQKKALPPSSGKKWKQSKKAGNKDSASITMKMEKVNSYETMVNFYGVARHNSREL